MEELQNNHKMKSSHRSAIEIVFGKLLVVLLALMLMPQSLVYAQKKHNFNPEQFERELEKYIISQANLNKEETAKFLPIYREMRSKLFVIFEKNRKKGFPDMKSDETCADAIRTRDVDDIRTKQIQRTYHNKMLKVLPGKKVMNIIHAEDEFHWKAIQRMDKEHAKKKK